MRTVHFLRRTHSQTATRIPSAETATTTLEAEILHAILQKLGRLREEQKANRETTQVDLQVIPIIFPRHGTECVKSGAVPRRSRGPVCRE